MKKKISLLGSTGSIGTQVLEVAQFLNMEVVALAANENINILELQARKFKPELVCVFNEALYKNFKNRVSDCFFKVVSGMEGLCEVASLNSANLVVNAVVGTKGLMPTLAAIEFKKDLAMANKESLVICGGLIVEKAKQNGIKILPIDSEHSAIFQCLEQNNRSSVSKIFLTASGGPFFGKTKLELEKVSVEQALNHPNWKMGKKISVDSATLMNKGLELIEACCLFGVEPSLIEIVVHPQSLLHSAVAYDDGAVIGQFGLPDMRMPIQLSLTWPKRVGSLVKQFSFVNCGNLSFFKPDYETFGCLKHCVRAAEAKGLMPCVLHAANEQAVELFLNGKIKFLQIEELISRAIEFGIEKLKIKNSNFSLEEVFKTIKTVQNFVKDLTKS